jgi:hypothetical protein
MKNLNICSDYTFRKAEIPVTKQLSIDEVLQRIRIKHDLHVCKITPRIEVNIFTVCYKDSTDIYYLNQDLGALSILRLKAG